MQNASKLLNIYAICDNILQGDNMINVKYYSILPEEAKNIRKKVFIEEQGFKNEFDETDNCCIHFLLYKDGTAAATGRMFTEDGGKSYHIGRIAVLKEYRKFHLGSAIMNEMIKKAKELNAELIIVSAQCRVSEFYEKLGFIKTGSIYMDEFCPHIRMELKL